MVGPVSEMKLIYEPLLSLTLAALPPAGGHSHREYALCVEGERDCVQVSDLHMTVALGLALVGPVLVALDTALLQHVRDHAHDRAVLLPDHAPEVGEGVGHGPLGGDVAVRPLIAVDVVGVDVAAGVVAVVAAELDSTVVVGEDVGVAVLGLVGVHQRHVSAEQIGPDRVGDLLVELDEAEVAVHVHLLHVHVEQFDVY